MRCPANGLLRACLDKRFRAGPPVKKVLVYEGRADGTIEANLSVKDAEKAMVGPKAGRRTKRVSTALTIKDGKATRTC